MGFNMAGNYIRTEEWKNKQRERQNALWNDPVKRAMRESILRSDKYRNKQRIASSGRKHTEETKRKISLAHKGRPKSEDHKRKLSGYSGEKASWFGRKHSEEEKEKMSNAQKLKPRKTRGERNGMWIDGRSINRNRKTDPLSIDWRKKVFKRDNYTCQKCGNYGQQLNAHHILSWANHPDERFNVDNGVTLCKSCHILVHRKQIGV